MRCVRSVGQGQTSIEPSVSSAAVMATLGPPNLGSTPGDGLVCVWFAAEGHEASLSPPVYPLCIAAAGLSYREKKARGGKN